MRGEVLMLILIYPQVAPCSLLVVVVAVDSTVVVVVDIVVVVVSIVVAVVLLVVAVVLLVVVVEVKLDVVAMVCVVARSVVGCCCVPSSPSFSLLSCSTFIRCLFILSSCCRCNSWRSFSCSAVPCFPNICCPSLA